MIGELEGKGWQQADPPKRSDDPSVVARVNGEPIKAGFRIERIEDSEDRVHVKYRSGQYDLEVKLDLLSANGQVKVERADGYD